MKNASTATASTATASTATANEKKGASTMTSKNTFTFEASTITVNGIPFAATYSLNEKTGSVYVFATVKDGGAEMPVRIHIAPNMPMYQDALAAVKPAKAEPAAAKAQAEPAKAPKAEPAAPKAKAEPKVKAEPKAKPAPKAQAEPAAAKAQAEPAKAPKAEPVKAEPVKAPALAEKAWIGTAIDGAGWRILFDAKTGRTRVTVDGTPSDAVKTAIEKAGFYWSSQLKSWNKKLTCKAYRAALALAADLAALA